MMSEAEAAIFYLNINMGFLNLLICFILETLIPKKHWIWNPNFNFGLAMISFFCAFLVWVT